MVTKAIVLKQLHKLIAVLLVLAIVSACRVQKSRSDQSKLGELYHNTTAHYNGYFNANELLEQSVVQLEQQHEDNYTKLLPIYPYLEAGNPKAVAGDLDLAIEKVSVVVNLHRYSKWTDDCYLLFGKAQYLKQDYESAEEAFRFFAGEFRPEKMKEEEKASRAERKEIKKKKSGKKKKKKKRKKKKKKKKSGMSKEKARAQKKYNKAVKKARKSGKAAPEKPEILQRGYASKAKAEEEKKKAEEEKKKKEEEEEKDKSKNGEDKLKHRPAYQEGMVWYAKTLVERNKYDAAERMLSNLEQDDKTYSDIRREIVAVRAYSYIEQKQYPLAIPALRQAIKKEKDKGLKSRYAYILAQLFELQNNYEGAYDSYEEALSYRPTYIMEFNCELNMAQNAYASGKGSALDARKNLEKLLKEDKNAPFKDQIYFAMARIDQQSGDMAAAISNYQLSLKSSTVNRAQKSETYLALAQIYFDRENYVPAKNYFDSTLQIMAASDERYKTVEGYANNLKEIAENLQIITLQDSLLRISKLSEEEKEALAMEIKKKEDEERRRKLKEGGGNTPNRSFPTRPGGPAFQKESSFFAYDDRAVKRGEREFSRKWGTRFLEDNWRRSASQDPSNFGDDDFDYDSGVLTEEEINKLLGDVPETEAELAAANLKIQEAMSKLGVLYRERLKSNEKAIAILEELERRYPGSTFELDAWYQLYLAYTDDNQPAKAKEYADKIIEKYPNTAYALIIRNPNYAEELVKEERQLNEYYEDAYDNFTRGQYQDAFQKSIAAKEKFGAANPLQPKFALLAAMSTGSIEGKDSYIQALRNVVARYPETDEQRRAREILRLLGETTAALPGGAKEAIEDYKMEENKLHYVIVAFSDTDIDLNAAKIAVSDYNQKYHKLDRLRISNIFLGQQAKDRVPLLVLRRFKDSKTAMDYYNGVQLNEKDFVDGKKMPYEVLPITQNNYRQVLKDKTVENYRIFFQANYLN